MPEMSFKTAIYKNFLKSKSVTEIEKEMGIRIVFPRTASLNVLKEIYNGNFYVTEASNG